MKKLHRLRGRLWPEPTGAPAILPAAKAEIKKILIWRKFDKEKREPGQSAFSFSQSGEMRLLKPLRGITFVFSVSFSDSFWDLWTRVILRKPRFTFFPSFFLSFFPSAWHLYSAREQRRGFTSGQSGWVVSGVVWLHLNFNAWEIKLRRFRS